MIDKALRRRRVMNEYNPYQAYAEGSIFSDSPVSLIVKLYQGAVDNVAQALRALESGDIMGRSKAVNKAYAIFSELIVSLDHERGGEISGNLQRLYVYMQERLLAAHLEKKAEPLKEIQGLLGTLLEGWRTLANGGPSAEPATSAALGARQSGVVSQAKTSSAPVANPYPMMTRSAYQDEMTSRSNVTYSF